MVTPPGMLLLSLMLPAYTFIGWHPGGAFFYQVQTLPAVQVCRMDANDIPAGWPEGTSVGPGVSCVDMPADVGGKPALDVAKKETKGVLSPAKNPYGLDVKIETVKDKKPTLVVVNGSEKKLALGEVDEAAKLAETHWRADGKALVVVWRSGKDTKELHADVAKLLVGGPAGRKLAEKLKDEGARLYKKRDWNGAGRVFEDAIAADPDWAPVRYARAAAEAQSGVGRTAMIENLQWLKEHETKDKEAKRLLAQARGDLAFDAWVGEPEVRELVGLPKVSTMDVPTRLLERDGVWTIQGATCRSPWLSFAFKRTGALTFTVSESCKGKKVAKSTTGTFKQTVTGPFAIELKKPIEGFQFPPRTTIVLDESYQQMKLQPDGMDPIGTFEPGAARVDDSTL